MDNDKFWPIIMILLLVGFIVYLLMGGSGCENFNWGGDNDTDGGDDDTLDCTDIHIANAFKAEYGDEAIAEGKLACELSGGRWFESKGELACDHYGMYDYPCDGDNAEEAEVFCEGAIVDKDDPEGCAATWKCSDITGYMGCYCVSQSEAPPSDDADCEIYCEGLGYDGFIWDLTQEDCLEGEDFGFEVHWNNDCCCYNEPEGGPIRGECGVLGCY